MFYSLYREPESSGVDALTQNWDALYGYAYPPHSTAPQSAQEDQTPPNSGGDPSGPILAEPNLVPPTNPDVSGLPQEVARQMEPPEEL